MLYDTISMKESIRHVFFIFTFIEVNVKNKILVVDDDALCRKAAILFTKNTDFLIEAVSSGKACIEFIKNNNVDLILLDMEMPEMNGYETLKEIRKTGILRNIPVVFMSGTEELLKKAISDGCTVEGILKKPFNPDTLIKTIQHVING